MELEFSPFGECGVRIVFGHTISLENSQHIIEYKRLIEHRDVEGITDLIPGYTTLTVFYSPLYFTYSEMKEKLIEIYEMTSTKVQNESLVFHIPTCYEAPFNLDLDDVASYSNLSKQDVITLHSTQSYYVYLLGFLPGFPYLGGMDKRLAMPRLESPRMRVLRGSVGIAGEQTGIYPLESPGGWRIIGRTPVQLYDRGQQNILLSPGHYIRFQPISYAEYLSIEEQVKAGTFRLKITNDKGE